jgi:hypothetical protein
MNVLREGGCTCGAVHYRLTLDPANTPIREFGSFRASVSRFLRHQQAVAGRKSSAPL